ncbi:NUDIX domain-containing protein [Streptomyces sp. OR43]|uniref:NUDIX domain-containing protein n=1 Tax=Streptomyces sp. or43 TaxID=2478957 RepID=UPI0021C77C97|nr:NUDIX domain-containing protein [Streptomyces sp. or43]
MSDAPHLQISDVAQVLLPANGADRRVFREAEAALAPEQLTVVGHLEAGESLDLAARRETEEESGCASAPSSRTSAGSSTAATPTAGWTGSPPCSQPSPGRASQTSMRRCPGYRWRSRRQPVPHTPSPGSTCSPTAPLTGL